MAGPSINVTNTFNVNMIVWLRSLPEGELGPSRRMAEDIETLARAGGPFAFEEIVVGSAAELVTALSALATRCRAGLRPILHFDCHGSEHAGLALAPAGDHLSWTALATALREVNVAADNNVCCIFGVCFGMHLSTTLSITEPTPYFLTIAPEREIAVGVLEERFPRFYQHLFASSSITDAYKAVLSPELGLFQCEEMFAKALATYLNNHTRGAAFRARCENLVSQIFAKLRIVRPAPEQLRHVRGHVKAGLKFSQKDFDCYSSAFLIGRQPSISLQQVEAIAQAYRRPPRPPWRGASF